MDLRKSFQTQGAAVQEQLLLYKSNHWLFPRAHLHPELENSLSKSRHWSKGFLSLFQSRVSWWHREGGSVMENALSRMVQALENPTQTFFC